MKTKGVVLALLCMALLSAVLGSVAYCQARDPLEPTVARFGSQPRSIVDFPTAGLPPRGGFYVEADIYSQGGVILNLGVGFARYFGFGISYGGLNVIGTGDPDMYPQPAVNVKARLIDESILVPAVAVGFDSQGQGPYLDREQRYLTKSRGIFAVASKNWDLLGPLSFHGGISYSLEKKEDDDPTVYVGIIKSFSDFLDVRAEYDFAVNDNEGDSPFIENRGYLNASVVWHVNENFSLGLEVRDIATKDKVCTEDLRQWNRGICIVYRDIL